MEKKLSQIIDFKKLIIFLVKVQLLLMRVDDRNQEIELSKFKK